MNNFKQFFKQGSVSSSIRNLYKTTVSSEGVSRLPVRTPFTINSKNVLQSGWFSRNSSSYFTKRIQSLLPRTTPTLLKHRDIHDAAQTHKKRPGFRKKRSAHQEQLAENGYFSVTAFATAEEYDLEKLLAALKEQDLYEPKKFFSSDDNGDNQPDVLYATAKYQVGAEPRGIYFFREGTVVMWNFSDMESSNILGFLKKFEEVKSGCDCEMRGRIYDFFFLF